MFKQHVLAHTQTHRTKLDEVGLCRRIQQTQAATAASCKAIGKEGARICFIRVTAERQGRDAIAKQTERGRDDTLSTTGIAKRRQQVWS